MNNKETRKRTNEIFAAQELLQQELEDVRFNCSHDSYRIGNWSWRPGAINVAKICNHCDEHVGTPSEEEVNLFDNPMNSNPTISIEE